MTKLVQPSDRFRAVAREAVGDEHLQTAMDFATARLRNHRLAAWGSLPNLEELRERAHEIRMRTIADLDQHLAEFTTAAERAGASVRYCASGEEARNHVTEICRRAGAKLAAKSKSMVSEEISLNEGLAAAGVEPVETDLGEYIVQLSGGHPTHIVAPAIDKTAADVAELFSRSSGEQLEPELQPLLDYARRTLRQKFLEADVGITGANFAVCETGSICLVTNEGNGRLVSSLPRLHVAVVGLERLVPTLDELSVLLRLLARSATGQPLTAYTTLLTGPRRAGEVDGPEELHIVILDNGRRAIAETRYREMLACIRCGACLNVCPVYRKTGGGAYGPVYSGPMGAVLAPLLVGLEHAPSLPHASSLCGACTEACPVKIPLHELLLELRADLSEQGIAPFSERLGFALWSLAWSTPVGYRLSTRLARLAQPVAGRLGPGRAWAAFRELPRFGRRYRDRR